MKVVKQKKRKKSIMLRLAVLAFVAYIVVTLVNQQVQISEKKAQLQSMNEQIRVQEIQNEDLKRVVNAGEGENEDYIERVAREGLDYAKPGERVFINIAGN